MNEVIINGIHYEAIDTPMIEGERYNCLDCDIFKAQPPVMMFQDTLCLKEENYWVNESCCKKENEGINRIWKIK